MPSSLHQTSSSLSSSSPICTISPMRAVRIVRDESGTWFQTTVPSVVKAAVYIYPPWPKAIG
eukprot:4459227-Karenia_brevis.AAC.1